MVVEQPKILVVSAHAADFCSRAGGTIVNYTKSGSDVLIIDLTYGERGESNSLWMTGKQITLEEVKSTREKEAINAAKILGAKIHFMDFDDNPLIVDKDRYWKLVDEVRKFKPEILLTHWLEDPLNPDHYIATNAIIQACVEATDPGVRPETNIVIFPEIFLFEPSVPSNELSNFRPDTFIDISSVFEVKLEALRAFPTQSGLSELYSDWGRFRAHQAVVRHSVHSLPNMRKIKYAEAFVRYTPWTGELFPLSLRGC